MSVIYTAFIVYDKAEYVGHKLYNTLSGLLQLKLAYVCHKTLVFLHGVVCSSIVKCELIMPKASDFTLKSRVQ